MRPRAPRGLTRNEPVIRIVAVIALVWGAVYLGWRALETWDRTDPALFLLLYACELFGWAMLASFCFLAWRIPASTRPPIGHPHSVDVLVCTYDEGPELLEATLLGCAGITYPHVTWVLDDGRREFVRELAERTGARYLTRPDNQHAKAGNINHALGVVRAELLLVLDADHVPQPDILDATVGYFDDPKVAVVQTPHDFGNHDSFQHFETGRHDQSMFFDVILPGKDRHNSVFWCGSAAVIRRAALTEVGGVATETIAEDFHTTIKMHDRGWKSRYHGETLVQGLAPHDLSSYLLQRDRWARGNLAVFRTPENPLRASNLSPAQRFSYLSSLLAYFVPLQRLGLLVVLTVMLVSGQLPMHATLSGFLIFWLPWIAFDLAASALLCRGRASLWDGTYSVLLTLEIFVRAARVVISPTLSTFKVTPKDGIDDGGWHALRQLHMVVGIAAILFCALVLRALTALGIVPLPHMGTAPFVIAMALGLWELALVVAALVKVSRRHQLRHHYRTPTDLAAFIDDDIVRMVDLTPAGAGILSPREVEVGKQVPLVVDLPMVDGRPRAVRLRLTVTMCRPDHESAHSWRIGGAVVPVTDQDHKALVEYCHVVAARSRLTESGRLSARVETVEPQAPAAVDTGGRSGAGGSPPVHATDAGRRHQLFRRDPTVNTARRR
jgi:cellulose synthase (UDP-forming)